MRTTLLIICLCFLFNWMLAQNYYVASLQGEVYYQNKLLQKKDKVIPKGNIRFKNAGSQVKLSGPGGLYTLSADMARASGGEFLLTLSDELFPSVRLISTVSPMGFFDFHPNNRNEWGFSGWDYTFLDGTALHIDSSLTANGQLIVFLHETAQGLRHQKADIRRDTMLVIHASDFANTPRRTLVLQISEPAVLDTILSKYKTTREVMNSAIFDNSQLTDTEKSQARNQILDELGICRFINKRAFLKDMRFHIKQSRPDSQFMFLEAYRFDEYIFETYGTVYQLEQVLAEELGLPLER